MEHSSFKCIWPLLILILLAPACTQSDTDLEISSYEKLSSIVYIRLQGTITNKGSHSAWYVEIGFDLFDDSGSAIDSDTVFPIVGSEFGSGDHARFEASFFKVNKWDSVDHVDYTIKWFDKEHLTLYTREGRID